MHNFKIFVNITNMDLKEFLKNLTKYNKNYNFTIINNKSDAFMRGSPLYLLS